MSNLTNQEVRALGKAVGLDLQDPELTQVAHSLNAILEAMSDSACRASRKASSLQRVM